MDLYIENALYKFITITINTLILSPGTSEKNLSTANFGVSPETFRRYSTGLWEKSLSSP